MRTLIIHNPFSGTRSDEVFAFQRSLIQPGEEVVMRATSLDTPVSSLLADARDFDAVVASGGDGTIGDIAYALHNQDVPMLVFPSGTANLLANNIGNATEPSALANTLRHGERVNLDICEFTYTDTQGVEHRRGSICMAGAGYDANLMQSSAALKQVFGQLSYYLAALGNLEPGVAQIHLVIDGEPLEAEGICVMVGNWAVVNQTIELIPGSNPLDGLLDVAIITAKHSLELLPTVFGGIMNRSETAHYPNVDVYRCKEVTVTCDPVFPMQYDGEVIENATTPFTARVIPGGLCTLVDSFSQLALENRR